MRQLTRHLPKLLAAVALSIGTTGCAGIVPKFDVPYDERGVPTAQTIVHQITCELAQLIEEDSGLAKALLEADVEAAFQLNLTVNDTGGLSPSVTYTNGVFSLGAGATVSQSREQNFTEKLYFSLRALKEEQIAAKKNRRDLTTCWTPDTNLSGDLGLRTAVQLAFSTPHLKWDSKLSGTDGAFGGYVDFVVTKSLNAVGPTWTLTHFKGPGGLASLSEVNTDKLIFAFARGGNYGKPFGFSVGKAKADQLLDSIILNQLSTQLRGLRQGS